MKVGHRRQRREAAADLARARRPEARGPVGGTKIDRPTCGASWAKTSSQGANAVSAEAQMSLSALSRSHASGVLGHKPRCRTARPVDFQSKIYGQTQKSSNLAITTMSVVAPKIWSGILCLADLLIELLQGIPAGVQPILCSVYNTWPLLTN
jgi:hypothetical protein